MDPHRRIHHLTALLVDRVDVQGVHAGRSSAFLCVLCGPIQSGVQEKPVQRCARKAYSKVVMQASSWTCWMCWRMRLESGADLGCIGARVFPRCPCTTDVTSE